jgi:hypothetical protein
MRVLSLKISQPWSLTVAVVSIPLLMVSRCVSVVRRRAAAATRPSTKAATARAKSTTPTITSTLAGPPATVVDASSTPAPPPSRAAVHPAERPRSDRRSTVADHRIEHTTVSAVPTGMAMTVSTCGSTSSLKPPIPPQP